MSQVQISTLADAPEEGKGKQIIFEHPYTCIEYKIGLFLVNGRYYGITDTCKYCNGSLGRGALNGLYVLCPEDETPWNIKTGACKFDRTSILPTYRVKVQDDGLFIEI